MEKDKILFRENDDGNYFYLVRSGILELEIKEQKIKKFDEWDYFGELALIQKCKRSGTVKCLTDVKLFVLDGHSFREKIKNVNSKKLRDKFFFIDMIPMIKFLDNNKKTNLARLINLVEFKKDEKIIEEGELGDRMYIIKEGTVSCRIKSNEIRKLYTNDFFGHNSILIECKRSLDVIAYTDCVCYEFSKENLNEALGKNYKEIILFSIFREAILSSKFFSEIFSENVLEKMFELFKINVYKNEDVIYKKDDKRKKILILIEGNMVNVKDLK
jgi:cGMP-dependent protein kinase